MPSRRRPNLRAIDNLGTFSIQSMMSEYNQSETLASNMLKKRDDTQSSIIGKI